MSQDKKAVAETKLTEEEKLFEQKKAANPEDTGDSDNYDAESGGEDSEDRPWRPSHTIFGKSTIRQSHLESMRGRYLRDISIVRAGEDNNTPAPEENEVVIFRSFFKAGLWFPLSRFVVEVLKTFQIFLHQLTPEAILRMGVFVWAARSQGIDPSAKCFCSMHELMYETKATEKNSITTTLIVMDLLPVPTQATQCQHFRKDGQEIGWKNGFM
jgi:hypothetical protein